MGGKGQQGGADGKAGGAGRLPGKAGVEEMEENGKSPGGGRHAVQHASSPWPACRHGEYEAHPRNSNLLWGEYMRASVYMNAGQHASTRPHPTPLHPKQNQTRIATEPSQLDPSPSTCSCPTHLEPLGARCCLEVIHHPPEEHHPAHKVVLVLRNNLPRMGVGVGFGRCGCGCGSGCGDGAGRPGSVHAACTAYLPARGAFTRAQSSMVHAASRQVGWQELLNLSTPT